MSFDSLFEQLKKLDNDYILAFLGDMEIGTYIHNPYFLVGMGVLAVCCLIFKWRLLLATIIGLTGLAWLVSYTTGQGASVNEGMESTKSMVYFVGGGVAIISLMIYLVFVKDE